MNRSTVGVPLGGFGSDIAAAGTAGAGDRAVQSGNAGDAAFIMKDASKVTVVPGYGVAVTQVQHIVREMADLLKKEGVDVKYAIHPVAGRGPGHMNVPLAGANVPYDEVFEPEQINSDFSTADVAYVISADDVTDPAAKTDPKSAIYGRQARPGRGKGGHRAVHQAQHGIRLRGRGERAVFPPQRHDAVRRCQEDDRGDRARDGVAA